MIKAIPNDPMLTHSRCRCMECGEYFNSVFTFTDHRVGTWEDRGTHRHCLSVPEMKAKGWSLNMTGHWISETRAEREKRRLASSLPAEES